MSQNAIISLKYAMLLPNVGSVRCVVAETIETATAKSLLRIFAIIDRKGKRKKIANVRIWLQESCVVSRQFEPAPPAQGKLRL